MGMVVDELRFADDKLLQRGNVRLVREPAGLVGIQQLIELLGEAVESLFRINEHGRNHHERWGRLPCVAAPDPFQPPFRSNDLSLLHRQ